MQERKLPRLGQTPMSRDGIFRNRYIFYKGYLPRDPPYNNRVKVVLIGRGIRPDRGHQGINPLKWGVWSKNSLRMSTDHLIQ